MRRSFLPPIITLWAVLAGSARATSVTVPDDFATIQGALDSGADTVLIRAGDYAERPILRQEPDRLLVQGLPESGSRPRMEGLIVRPFYELQVKHCSFTGAIDLDIGRSSVDQVTFDSCDLDSGLIDHPQAPYDLAHVSILRSRIRGPIALAERCEADTFDACGVTPDDREGFVILDCIFAGPGDRAINFFGAPSAHVLHNSIDGYSIGISSGRPEGPVTIDGNHIAHCTTTGILAEESASISNNVIDECGTGMVLAFYDHGSVVGNVVRGSSGSGIHLVAEPDVDVSRNVVGRNGGNGILVETLGSPGIRMHDNTSYRNLGAGYRVLRLKDGAHVLDLKRNIAFENGTYGVDADTSSAPDSCNDWYGNRAGATRGVVLSGTDLAVDPLFCDVVHDSVGLAEGSPLLDAPGCGLIGAREQGCAVSAVLIERFEAVVVDGAVEVRWRLRGGGEDAWVERALRQDAPWSRIASERLPDGGYVARDHDVVPETSYLYRLTWMAGAGLVHSAPIAVTAAVARNAFALAPIAPNPSAGAIQVRWTMPREGDVDVRVLDLTGREVARISRGRFTAGHHVVSCDGRSAAGPVPSGLYFVRVRTEHGRGSRAFLLRR